MLDRAVAPNFKEIDKVLIQEVRKETLPNKIPFFYISSGTEEVLQLELVFKSGKYYENQEGLSFLMATTIGEGTQSYSSKAISETFDRYGVFWSAKSGYDLFSFQFYLMSKHMDKVIPIIKELLTSATFPTEEVEVIKEIKKQEVRINSTKTNIVSPRIFKEKLFGKNHPYGRYVKEEDISLIKTEHLHAYFDECIKGMPFEVFLCGVIDEYTLNLVRNEFGSIVIDSVRSLKSNIEIVSSKSEYIQWDDALQTSISVGNLSLKKSDNDYHALLFTTILLGGYFGSRLMKNIREEKGLTYGIHASIKHLERHSYFSIHADVIKEKRGEALLAIKEEINSITKKKISESELQTVKNYIIGSFLSSLNTPFALMGTFTSLHFHGLEYSFIQDYIKKVKLMNSNEVNRVASTYLKPSEMIEVSVG